MNAWDDTTRSAHHFPASLAASVVFHAAALMICSWILVNSRPANWVTFTDITVIGVSPKGEGMGMKSETVSPLPQGVPTAQPKTVKSAKEQMVQVPSVKPGPSAEQLAAVRAAFPIGVTQPAAVPSTGPAAAAPDVEGYGQDTGRPGVPWGKEGVSGPLAQRAIKRQVLPEYPAWAREQGIAARVEVGIRVTPDGKVQPDVRLLKKSGYRDLDDVVVAAVRKWEFEPLPSIAKQEEQYGVIPIRFALTK